MSRWLAPIAFVLGVGACCNPIVPPREPIPASSTTFLVWVDDNLPLSRVEAAEEEWHEVGAGVNFVTVQIPHEYALSWPDAQLRPVDVLLVDDPWTVEHCDMGPLVLACSAKRRVRFDSREITAGQWWDRVPAHELGHAVCDLDDNHEEYTSIMCKNVQCQAEHPTLKDGARCAPRKSL